MKTAIRIIITCGLLYGIYTETGIFTTIAISLIFIGAEIVGYKVSKMLG